MKEKHVFKIVEGRPVWVFCYSCGGSVCTGMTSSSSGVWADLQGPPFKAYYCGQCMTNLSTSKERDIDGTTG